MVTARQQSILSMRERYGIYGIKKIGYVDIEATNLKAEVGHTLSIVNVVRTVDKRVPVDTRVYKMTKKELEQENAYLKMRIADLERRINRVRDYKYPEQGEGYKARPNKDEVRVTLDRIEIIPLAPIRTIIAPPLTFALDHTRILPRGYVGTCTGALSGLSDGD